MELTVNGEKRTCEAGLTLEAFLKSQNVKPESVVVEHNGKIIPFKEFGTLCLQDGDELEVLRFMGGG